MQLATAQKPRTDEQAPYALGFATLDREVSKIPLAVEGVALPAPLPLRFDARTLEKLGILD